MESHVLIDAESVLFRQLSAIVDTDVFQYNYASAVRLRREWIKEMVEMYAAAAYFGPQVYPTRRQPLSTTTMMALLLTFSRLRPLRYAMQLRLNQ